MTEQDIAECADVNISVVEQIKLELASGGMDDEAD